ncbi:MAG: ATP-dependent DNA helicase RecG [Candidatus Wildermuthbacteria bacterium]|nr:ATP-dependent DNA helicase RecG [Candidatus Wildermuthbacteria bacterium]
MTLSTSLSEVPRVGPVYQKRLKGLGIANVRDLLFYFPRAYEDFSKITPIAELKEGMIFCVRAKVLEIKEQRTFKKRMSLITALVQDNTGATRVLWFNQPYLVTSLEQGDEVYLAGKALRDKQGIYLANPAHEKPILHPGGELTHVGRIVPVYAETAGVSSRWLRSIIKSVLARLEDVKETLPEHMVKERKLLAPKKAFWQIHFPDTLTDVEAARNRFAFEELFYILLFILSERKKIASIKAPPLKLDVTLMSRFTKKLPFSLTDSQKKAAWQVLKDIENPRPMNRLLEGDVGSGKTVVAAMAALSCAKAGYQTVFMAPTEILAQQHFKNVGSLLAPFKVTVGLLTGTSDRFISPKLPNDFIEVSRTKLLKMALEGKVDLVIGTHALIQEKVKFGRLGLVIVDEQHRFGIQQRAKLLHRSTLIPHLLSLTATPIPRTLALTVYGDLDLTLIPELPKGRKEIITKVVPPEERKKTYAFIEKEVKQGRQVFVICPRIEKSAPSFDGAPHRMMGRSTNSETIETKNVKEEHEKLSKEVFPRLKVAMLHGKMAQKEKELVMRRFRMGKIDILVSTSVVEVGVDIQNASVMMIEGAERFGLAQLHQFRGRVGRAEHQSYCFLLTESSSSGILSRLRAMQKAKNGFELAEMDLRIRGAGSFTGTKQWGIADFAMTQLTNLELVEEAREAAKKLLEEDITLKKYPLLKAKVQELRSNLHLE